MKDLRNPLNQRLFLGERLDFSLQQSGLPALSSSSVPLPGSVRARVMRAWGELERVVRESSDAGNDEARIVRLMLDAEMPLREVQASVRGTLERFASMPACSVDGLALILAQWESLEEERFLCACVLLLRVELGRPDGTGIPAWVVSAVLEVLEGRCFGMRVKSRFAPLVWEISESVDVEFKVRLLRFAPSRGGWGNQDGVGAGLEAESGVKSGVESGAGPRAEALAEKGGTRADQSSVADRFEAARRVISELECTVRDAGSQIGHLGESELVLLWRGVSEAVHREARAFGVDEMEFICMVRGGLSWELMEFWRGLVRAFTAFRRWKDVLEVIDAIPSGMERVVRLGQLMEGALREVEGSARRTVLGTLVSMIRGVPLDDQVGLLSKLLRLAAGYGQEELGEWICAVIAEDVGGKDSATYRELECGYRNAFVCAERPSSTAEVRDELEPLRLEACGGEAVGGKAVVAAEILSWVESVGGGAIPFDVLRKKLSAYLIKRGRWEGCLAYLEYVRVRFEWPDAVRYFRDFGQELRGGGSAASLLEAYLEWADRNGVEFGEGRTCRSLAERSAPETCVFKRVENVSARMLEAIDQRSFEKVAAALEEAETTLRAIGTRRSGLAEETFVNHATVWIQRMESWGDLPVRAEVFRRLDGWSHLLRGDDSYGFGVALVGALASAGQIEEALNRADCLSTVVVQCQALGTIAGRVGSILAERHGVHDRFWARFDRVEAIARRSFPLLVGLERLGYAYAVDRDGAGVRRVVDRMFTFVRGHAPVQDWWGFQFSLQAIVRLLDRMGFVDEWLDIWGAALDEWAPSPSALDRTEQSFRPEWPGSFNGSGESVPSLFERMTDHQRERYIDLMWRVVLMRGTMDAWGESAVFQSCLEGHMDPVGMAGRCRDWSANRAELLQQLIGMHLEEGGAGSSWMDREKLRMLAVICPYEGLLNESYFGLVLGEMVRVGNLAGVQAVARECPELQLEWLCRVMAK